MWRLNSHRLLVALVIIFIGWGQMEARPPWIDQKLGAPDGSPNSVAQQQEPETMVTSFVIGGVTLQEDVKNPPVPSGMQRFEITMNKPVVTVTTLREPEMIPNFDGDTITLVTVTRGFDIDRDFVSYPLAFLASIYTAPDLAASPDSLTLTGTINLPEGVVYQVLIGQSDPDPIEEQQQYFFGTVELPETTVSGVAILPEGFTPSERSASWVGLFDPALYSKALEIIEEDTDLINFGVVRATNLNEQQEFELPHVQDGSYALIVGQRAVDPQGNEVQLLAFRGINSVTGAVTDPEALIQVVDGKSVTGVEIVLQKEPEPVEIREVGVQSVDVENNSFFIQRGIHQVRISVSEALMIDLGQRTVDDILSIFFSGNVDSLASLFFPISDLMPGDTVSILGIQISDSPTVVQAVIVIRESQPLRGDLDRDGDIDFTDFLLFVEAFNTNAGDPNYNLLADIDDNGVIDFTDFLSFINLFGTA